MPSSCATTLKSVRAYLLKEDFQGFWEYVSPAWAGKFLDRWCTRTMRSKIEPMKRVARMLRSHRELLLNWFRARGTVSAGVTEGLNNKLKLTLKKAYGFRTFQAVEVALYHTLGDLPQPTPTHRFWRGTYLSIRYTERLALAGIEPSVGSRGDSYDNALAETMIGLYKTELVYPRGPWQSLEDVELATLEWVWWFNNHRLFGPHGHIPPAEYEELYLSSQTAQPEPLILNETSLR